jgi:hypothetical protein
VLELLKKYALKHSLDPLAVPDTTHKFNVVSSKEKKKLVFVVLFLPNIKL